MSFQQGRSGVGVWPRQKPRSSRRVLNPPGYFCPSGRRCFPIISLSTSTATAGLAACCSTSMSSASVLSERSVQVSHPFGMTFKRSIVNGKHRVEIVDAPAAQLSWLKSLGCFTEIIQYRRQAFVPANCAETVIGAILKPAQDRGVDLAKLHELYEIGYLVAMNEPQTRRGDRPRPLDPHRRTRGRYRGPARRHGAKPQRRHGAKPQRRHAAAIHR